MQYTKALLHFNNPDNLLFDEVTSNKWTSVGSLTSDSSTRAKFGKGLAITYNSGFQITLPLGAQSFTVECWYYPTSSDDHGPYFTIYNSESNFVTPEVYGYYYYRNYDYVTTNSGLNKLNHVAVAYDHNTKRLYMFLNGKVVYNNTTSLYTTRQNFKIGFGLALWTDNGSNRNNAWGASLCRTAGVFDEIRISDGIARWTAAYALPTQQYIYGPYAEFPSNLDGTYTTAPNKLKYYYKVKFEQGPYTTTSNVVNYVTEWGIDKNCGNRFEPSCGSVEFTSTNASNSVQILSQAANAAINRLQEELNKYIGPFDNTKNTRTGSHKSKGNNQTYYWKIEATGKIDQYTSTGADATFKAVWGTSPNNYNVTYISSNFTKGSIVHDGETIKDVYAMSSDGTVNFRITPITYSHREAVFTEIINKLKNNLELQFDSYIGTVETTYPYISRSITSAGTNYYARVYPTSSGNTSITATKAILKLKLYWSAGLESVDSEFGTGKAGIPGNAGDGEKEFTINASNYTNLESFIATEAATMLNTWEAYARTLFSKLTQAPGKQEDSWNTTTGNKIWVLMTFSLDSNPTTMADQTKQIINSKFKYSLTSGVCDKEYKDGSITLDSSNYSMKETLFQNHFNATVAEFKNDFSFLNSVPPEDNTINHTALNGLTYTCKYSWEFAERDASRAVYRLVSSYSLASDLSNATEFSRQRTVEVDRNTVAYDIRMQRFNAAFELEKVALENHLNTLLASVTIPDPIKDDSFVAFNGRIYAYRVLCTVAPGDSDAEKKVTIKSEWGKTTTYGNEFATSTFTLTAVNQKAFDLTVARVMRAHQVKLEGFLNLLIEDVIFQGANGTKRASNGSNYNYRTSVTGVGITTKTPAQYIQETGTIETFSE